MNQPGNSGITILHVATAISWRGGEQQVAYLVSELANKHINQFVMCSTGSVMEEYCKKSGIPYFSANKRSSVDITYAKKIKDICVSNNINLIHAHDSHAHSFAVLSAVFGNKTKIIVSRRVDFEVSRSPISKYKYNHPLVSRILCVSDKIRSITMKAVADPLKVVTVHSGIDFTRFNGKQNQQILHTQYNIPDHIKLIGNIAALAPHKDLGTFVRTAALLQKKITGTMFFIIGEGDERSRIEKIIEETGSQGNIILTGFRTDIPNILPELDLLLITSETEGLGTTILDAFACGVPVVATAAGGIPELVIHEQTGLLAAVGDTAGLAGQVERLMDGSPLREKVIKGAFKHLEGFTKEATASKTLMEYLAVTGSNL